MSRIEAITIEAADRDELERLVRDRNTAQKVVWRARIVLLAAEGLPALAIATATGKVIGQCMPRHRHQEWLKFLRAIDRATPKGLDLHLIADNYATHKHPTVKAWLAKHPRFHRHFTPTSASWLNQVERFFGLITDKRIRRGVFRSVGELESAIMDYLDQHNAQPKPFVWTKSAGEILEKVARAKQASESQH